jgi:hypothetical protein
MSSIPTCMMYRSCSLYSNFMIQYVCTLCGTIVLVWCDVVCDAVVGVNEHKETTCICNVLNGYVMYLIMWTGVVSSSRKESKHSSNSRASDYNDYDKQSSLSPKRKTLQSPLQQSKGSIRVGSAYFSTSVAPQSTSDQWYVLTAAVAITVSINQFALLDRFRNLQRFCVRYSVDREYCRSARCISLMLMCTQQHTTTRQCLSELYYYSTLLPLCRYKRYENNGWRPITMRMVPKSEDVSKQH